MSNNVEGSIKGRPGRGLVTSRKDGSILLENVTISAVRFMDYDTIAESGEKPIAADRIKGVRERDPRSQPLRWASHL